MVRVASSLRSPPLGLPLTTHHNYQVRKLRSLPACPEDGQETDFRWIESPAHAYLVARYELAREVFLVADALLSTSPKDQRRFRAAVADGKPFSGMFYPEGWPSNHYQQLVAVLERSQLKDFDLPPATTINAKFRPKPSSEAKHAAIGIRRIAKKYDQYEAEDGPDYLYELSVSKFELPSLAQAVKDFEAWARRSGCFDTKNPGGRPSSILLHLAYFRAEKGNAKPKLGKWFGEVIGRSSVITKETPAAEYGVKLFAPCMGKGGVSAATWSEGVARVWDLVMPGAEELVARYLSSKR